MAIIAVMVAIAIPTFSNQLEKSREGTDISNIRAAYSEVAALSLTDPDTAHTAKVALTQTQSGWQTTSAKIAGVDLSDISLTGLTLPSGEIEIASAAGTGLITIAGKAVTSSFVADSDDGDDDDETPTKVSLERTATAATVTDTGLATVKLDNVASYFTVTDGATLVPGTVTLYTGSGTYTAATDATFTATAALGTDDDAGKLVISITKVDSEANLADITKIEVSMTATKTGLTESNAVKLEITETV